MEPVFLEGLHKVPQGAGSGPARISSHKWWRWEGFCRFLDSGGIRTLAPASFAVSQTEILQRLSGKDQGEAGAGRLQEEKGFFPHPPVFLSPYPSVPCPLCEGSSLGKPQLLLALAIPLKKHTLAGRGGARL